MRNLIAKLVQLGRALWFNTSFRCPLEYAARKLGRLEVALRDTCLSFHSTVRIRVVYRVRFARVGVHAIRDFGAKIRRMGYVPWMKRWLMIVDGVDWIGIVNCSTDGVESRYYWEFEHDRFCFRGKGGKSSSSSMNYSTAAIILRWIFVLSFWKVLCFFFSSLFQFFLNFFVHFLLFVFIFIRLARPFAPSIRLIEEIFPFIFQEEEKPSLFRKQSLFFFADGL